MPYVVVLAFGTISHIICGQMCSSVQCFNVFAQQKHQEVRTIIDVCECAMFGCDGMCFDALFGMFRTLCSCSIIVRTFFTNSKHSVLFCQKKKTGLALLSGRAELSARARGTQVW